MGLKCIMMKVKPNLFGVYIDIVVINFFIQIQYPQRKNTNYKCVEFDEFLQS